jgi:nitrate reductase cytochrome c-type subunit
MDMWYANKKYVCYILSGICFLMMTTIAHAVITGQCSNCHTMHNSQGGAEMTTFTDYTFTSPATAQPYLLRGTCLGCHAQGTANKIESISGTDVPQVLHNDPSGDLAGGNFIYQIGGGKGGAGSDKKGHNLVDFGAGNMDTPAQPPGRRHDIANINTLFTCAGSLGCHGIRGGQGRGLEAIKGSHHGNVDGQLSDADTVANSYRFLYYVIGLENTNTGASKWQNVDATNHNEYYGATEPMDFDSTGCDTCHDGITPNRPDNKTMSGFCATCHGYFHLFDDDSGNEGVIINDRVPPYSPFKRHPTDVVLPGGGEYADIAGYSVVTPVARTTPPNVIDAGVSASDAVMCLSCHGAHATDFYKMLRWDIKGPLATAISGCGNCHTGKN